MLYVVTKKFNAFGTDLRVDDVVDAGGWRNERLLLEHRYIARTDAPHTTVSVNFDGTPVKRGRGRPRKTTSLLASPIKGSRKKVAKKEN